MYAAQVGFYDRVEFLIKHGVNPKIQDKDGKTALDYAKSSWEKDPRIQEILK